MLQWNSAALQAIRTLKPGPTMTSRALAMLQTSMYDAWAAYDLVANGTQLGGQLRRSPVEFNDGFKSKAMSYAAYATLSDLYPTQKESFTALMQKLGYDPAASTESLETPEGVGHRAAVALLDYRHHDGSNQLGDMGNSTPYGDYTGYMPMNPPMKLNGPTALADMPHPDRWQPITFTNAMGVETTQAYLTPHWGKVTPFAMNTEAARPAAPLAYGSDDYRAEVAELVKLNAELTDEQKVIVEYWADGPASELPPGHWNLFARFVSLRDNHSLDDDTKMFFAMTNAVMDAGITVWDTKRAYDTSRPITAVRALYNDQKITAWAGRQGGTAEIDGASWKPFQPDTFPTPPFPEFVSGHSCFSSSGATVLALYTGSDKFGMSATIPAASLKAEPTAPASEVTLSWDTFTAAAEQAGMSRRYGGIHFRQADDTSRDMGTKCGQLAFEKAKSFWEGRN